MDSYEPGVEAEGSGEFGAEDQEAAWITRRTITAIALFVLLILLGGAVLVIAIGYIGAGYDGEDTRKDDLNRQTPVIPPAKYTDLVMTSPGPASYQSASNAEDLICTMGEDAELPETYPEDGLCDYLYYMNVWISSDTGKLTYSSQKSWEVFQEQMQARSITGGGISFNYLWFPYGSLSSNVTRTLEMLAAHNVKHYGFLDVIDSKPSSVGSLLFLGLDFLRKLKEIQGDDRTRKLIVAMGFYGHSVAADAWADYGDRFKHVVQSLPDVDIFITISSTAFSKHSLECTAFPPSVMTAFNDTYQSLERHAKMVNANFDLTKDATVVGFSLEMGTLTYELVDKAASTDDIAYKKCSARNFANASILCPPEPGIWKDLDTVTRAGFTNSSDRRTVFLGDTADTLATKVNFVRGILPKRRSPWLLYNVHLTDTSLNCFGSPFERVSRLKSLKRT